MKYTDSRPKSQCQVQLSGPIQETEGLRILLVEDDKVNQIIAGRLLENNEHEVVIAQNGKEAVDMVQNENFDLVLMDINMPVMDGLEATRAIRKWEKEMQNPDYGIGNKKAHPFHIPIIALTALAFEGFKEKCLGSGMDGYISKPVSEAMLIKSLEPFV